MAAEPDPFEREIIQNCPADASYYYLVRYNQKREPIRFPSTQALSIRGPFEYPIDCKPGTWLVVYSSDSLGNRKVQHIGNRAHVQVELQIPNEVCDGVPEEGKTTKELVELLSKPASDPDEGDEGLKATRIDAKKREIALDIASKEQKVIMRGAMNKEAIEAYTLNRFHRTELHAQVEAMFKFQALSAAMMERNYVLAEKAQEAIGRASEMEKAAAQKIAMPPPPPDYTPVLSSVVSAIRDIGVSAMQRDERRTLKPDESTPPVKAALGDKAGDPAVLAAAASSQSESKTTTEDATRTAVSVLPGPATKIAEVPKALSAPQTSPKTEPSRDDLLAQLDRMKSELEAERNRNRVLDELRASPAPPEIQAVQTTPSGGSSAQSSSRSSRESFPVRVPGSLFPRSITREDRCPCGSGRAYKKCCLRSEPPPSSRSLILGPSTPSRRETARPYPTRASTPSPIRTARPHGPDASTSSQHEPARPHPTRASTSVPGEPARPHSSDASTSSQHEPARPHRFRASTSIPSESARPHASDASTSSPHEPARPHLTRASTSVPGEPARPHAPDASTSSQHEPARPHPTRASTSVPSESARPHSAAASTSSLREPARPQSASPAQVAAPPALLASEEKGAAPSAQTISEITGQPLVLPDGALSPGLQELLVNIQASKFLDDPNEAVPAPLVVQVKQVEAVLVKPPTLDRETARRLLLDGSTMEAFGALLFFNPILRDILLSRRGT